MPPRGTPLKRRTRGNCLRCSPLKPVLPQRHIITSPYT